MAWDETATQYANKETNGKELVLGVCRSSKEGRNSSNNKTPREGPTWAEVITARTCDQPNKQGCAESDNVGICDVDLCEFQIFLDGVVQLPVSGSSKSHMLSRTTHQWRERIPRPEATYTLEPVPGQPGGNNKEGMLGAALITKLSGFAGTVLGAQDNLRDKEAEPRHEKNSPIHVDRIQEWDGAGLAGDGIDIRGPKGQPKVNGHCS